MKYTLLAMTQDILASMDSDQVNSINDNIESQQVAKVIRTVYNDIITRADLKELKVLFNLTASGTSAQPTLMTIPNNIIAIEWVKYNKIRDGDTDADWQPVYYLALDQFMELMLSYKVSTGNITNFTYTPSIGGSTLQFYCQNDIAPTWYTTIDDNQLIFDSYDSDVDTTLQSSKTTCYGQQTVTFSMTDTYIPPLEDHQFMLLFNEACARCHAEIKQAANLEAKAEGRKQWIHLQKTKESTPQKVPALNKLPNYGRRGGWKADWPVDNMIQWMRKGS